MKNRADIHHHENLEHISICICTYKRASQLIDLLDKLQNQETGNLFYYSVIIVDNDYHRSAESAVLTFKRESRLNIEYLVEPEQNISLARNMAVKNSQAAMIAFIDDDEIPEDDWLYMLYCALRRYTVDGVLGPVLPLFKTKPPRWVITGRFYQRPTYNTGFVIDWRKGRTGNILLKKAMFDMTGEMFDPKFGSGAEDQDFVRRMIKKNYVFIWCNEARAYEYVPPIRWKRIFMIKRALLRGKMSLANPEISLLTILTSCLAVPFYTLGLPILLLLGHHWFMQYLIKDFDHLGRILALLGLNPIKQRYIVQ